MSAAVRPTHENAATPSNGHKRKHNLQDTLDHLPWTLPRDVWWREWARRLRRRFKKGWDRVVAKSQGKYQISQPLALSILGAMFTFGSVWYWRSSETIATQHDEIIRLQTKLELEEQKNIDQDSKIDQARNMAAVADKNNARLEGKFDQFSLTYSIKNASKTNGGLSP